MKRTVRYHRGDSPFKLKSPLKEGGDGTKTVSKTTEPARSGDVKGTWTKTIKRVKTAKVGDAPTSKATKKYTRQRPPHTKAGDAAYKAMTPEQQKAADAKWNKEHPKKEVAAAAKGANTSTTNEGSETEIEEGKFNPEKTEKVEGTTSDTFTAEERRIQNRGEKIVKRHERQSGKQALRKDKQYMKNTAEWKGMTPQERKAALNELKHGQTNKDAEKGSALDRFSEGFKGRVNKAREMKYGQGEVNQDYVNQEVNHPGDAAATRGGQYSQQKGTVNSTEFKNKADIKKEQAGGKDVKVTAEEKATLKDVPIGETKTVKESSSTNSGDSAEKAKKTFGDALSRFDAKKDILAKPAATQNNKEQSDALDQHKEKNAIVPKGGNPKEAPATVAKMTSKSSGFSMKGFGSKAGFNFNKKK